MQTIFVMVKCDLGRAYDVADAAVQNVEQVSEIHSISGQYDLMMKCYLTDDQDIGHFVMGLQRLPGVKDTFTLIAFKAFACRRVEASAPGLADKAPSEPCLAGALDPALVVHDIAVRAGLLGLRDIEHRRVDRLAFALVQLLDRRDPPEPGRLSGVGRVGRAADRRGGGRGEEVKRADADICHGRVLAPE